MNVEAPNFADIKPEMIRFPSIEAKFCADIAFRQAQQLRPLLMPKNRIENLNCLDEISGSADNPCLTIDYIGHQSLDDAIIDGQPTNTSWLYIEELKSGKIPYPFISSNRMGIFDPIDETSDIKRDKFTQTSGILIADRELDFYSAAVVSLVDNRILLLSRRSALFMHYDENNDLIAPWMPHPGNIKKHSQLRIAILEKRIPEILANTHLSINVKEITFIKTFGGFGLLELVDGKIDAMIDPVKGQPWYEAVLWGWCAERLGLVVTDPKGNHIDFLKILNFAKSTDGANVPRVPIVISRNHELHNQLIENIVNA